MEDSFLIASIALGVVLILILMFVLSKFLMREQSYDRLLEQKKLELENVTSEQKSGKQKRRHVYSKHSDKSKLAEDKPKLADDKQKTTDQKQKHLDSKQKVMEEKQQSSDEKQKSPAKKCDETLSPKKRVEIVAEAEAIYREIDLSSLTSTPEKSLSSHPSRSILVNKDEKSLIIDAESVPETFHPRPAPVDELDRKQQEEVRRLSGTLQITNDEVEQLKEKSEQWTTPSSAGKLSQKKKKKVKASEPAEELEGKPISSEVLQDNAAAPSSASGKSPRKNAKELVTATVSMLEKGEIEESDCKRLLKSLEDRGFDVLAKCDGINEDDHASEVHKRKIKDLELALQKDKSALMSANAQIKQLKEELSNEHQKSENLAKTHQVISTKQNQELVELKDRLELFSKTKDQELKQYKTHLDALKSENINTSHTVKALMEENERQKEISRQLEQKLLEKQTVIRFGDSGDASQRYLEDNIKQFENQFEEIVAKQEMEKLKEENDTVVHSLRKHIEELKVKIAEKDGRIESLLARGAADICYDDQPDVCEHVKLTENQKVLEVSIPDHASNGLIVEGNEPDQSSSQAAMIKELQELLQAQKLKNDDLRRRNWKTMEALSELEKELQHSQQVKYNRDSLISQLKFVQEEKENLLRINKEQVKTNAKMQHQIDDLKKEVESRDQHREWQQSLGKDVDVIKLEESLNRQIQKNDNLRRRNWKTMEALAEMEKQMEGYLLLKSQHDDLNKVSELNEQIRFLQKEKQDLEVLNKGLNANLATCFLETEHAEKRLSDALGQFKKVNNDIATLKAAKMSADNLNDSLQRRVGQLESFLTEKNARIRQLEDDLLSQKTVARDLSEGVLAPRDDNVAQPGVENQSSSVAGSPARSAAGDDVNRKEVMVVTRIQETAKWDLSQLVLELDTKTAEVEILQSLLDHNEKTLHDLQDEKSKNLESVHHMRQALKERDVTIELLKSQLKTASGPQGYVPEFEPNSIGEVLSQKDSEIEQLKAELLQYQAKIKVLKNIYEKTVCEVSAVKLVRSHFKEQRQNESQLRAQSDDFETRNKPFHSPSMLQEPISEDGREVFNSTFDNSLVRDDDAPVEIKALQDQVKHYQDVLADTVGMLSKLQSSVEQEENKWRQKFEVAEEKAAKAHHEAEQLRIELETLRQSS